MRTTTSTVLGLLTTCLLGSPTLADIWMPSVFSDHMVIQRDMPIAVWGTAQPGTVVQVELLNPQSDHFSSSLVETDSVNGEWEITLPPVEANKGSWELTVTEFDKLNIDERKKLSTRTFTDVLVGEVWLCGGQSNMEWSLNAIGTTANQKKSMIQPQIRLINAPRVVATEPQQDIDSQWQLCTPETIGNWTAVGYYFGDMLLEELNVPIGLISSNWGGTRIEPWIERADLANHPTFAERTIALQGAIDQFNQMDDNERLRMKRLAEEVNARNARAYWKQILSKDPGATNGWMTKNFDDSSWSFMALPGEWERQETSLATFDGTVWFRKTVEIPTEWAGKPLVLTLGRIDDSDTTYFNGNVIGTSTNQHQTVRRYEVPAKDVAAGQAVIAVCALDPHGAGGFTGPKMSLSLADGGSNQINLAGNWKWHKGYATTRSAPSMPTTAQNPGMNPQSPGALHDGMIAPFVPYTMRGAIWYQGESNSEQPAEYRELLPLLIESWREDFGDHLAFGIVQLAAFRPESDNPDEGGWAYLRDAQLNTAQTVPNTGIAITTDVGEANDIHPRNKKAVGDRLAGWALHDVYGIDGAVPSSPIQTNVRRDGNAVMVTFDHVQNGLQGAADSAKIGGFALAGPDGRFHWANATIEGKNRVRVWSNEVADPHIVQYGWQNNPTRANLVNSADLPASPFRATIAGGSSGR